MSLMVSEKALIRWSREDGQQGGQRNSYIGECRRNSAAFAGIKAVCCRVTESHVYTSSSSLSLH